MLLKTIFFDFDGVIADSLDVKSKAFYSMYASYGKEIAESVVEHHLANGGISRFEKFKIYHQEFLNLTLSEGQINELANQFSKLVVSKVISSDFVSGVYNFIKSNYSKYDCYIITGTPTDEMKIIAEARGIDVFFKGIYGSPNSKDYWVKYLLSSKKLQKEECIFIGDALADYDAAIKNNIKFIVREHKDNKNLFPDKNILHIRDFENFSSFIKNYL